MANAFASHRAADFAAASTARTGSEKQSRPAVDFQVDFIAT